MSIWFLSLMQGWSRRKFVIAGVITSAAAIGGLGRSRSKRPARGSIKLQPIEGIRYTESFLRFMERARFDSVRDAVACIRDRSIPVQIMNVEPKSKRVC